MDIYILAELCHEWALLGWAVQEQAEAVLAGDPIEEQNFNALEMIIRFLEQAADYEVEDADFIIEQIKEVIEEARLPKGDK